MKFRRNLKPSKVVKFKAVKPFSIVSEVGNTFFVDRRLSVTEQKTYVKAHYWKSGAVYYDLVGDQDLSEVTYKLLKGGYINFYNKSDEIEGLTGSSGLLDE